MLFIVAQYTVKKALLNNIGETATLKISPGLCDIPKIVTDKSRQFSYRGRRSRSTIHGRWYEGQIVVPIIWSDDRFAWRQFLESVAEDEPFTLNYSQIMGYDSDINMLNVFIPSDSLALQRFNIIGNNHKFEFDWRETDNVN